MRRILITAGVLAVAAIAGGCSQAGGPFPAPPRQDEIHGPVLLSANGRTITAYGRKACGHRPLLIAHSYKDRVALAWLNPDTNCNSESIILAVVSTSLPAPLGGRALVQASDGARVAYTRTASNSPVTRAFTICLQHFWPRVRQAMMTTVAGVTRIGPAAPDHKRGPLHRYQPNSAVALCLIPSGPGKYSAVAIVLSDNQSYVRWTQNNGSDFTFPS